MEDAYSRDVLRVVTYGPGAPVLEKRHFFVDRAGKWRPGKCRGLTGIDLAVLLSCLEQFEGPLMRPWKQGGALLKRPGEAAD
jgi:hypothetical protein